MFKLEMNNWIYQKCVLKAITWIEVNLQIGKLWKCIINLSNLVVWETETVDGTWLMWREARRAWELPDTGDKAARQCVCVVWEEMTRCDGTFGCLSLHRCAQTLCSHCIHKRLSFALTPLQRNTDKKKPFKLSKFFGDIYNFFPEKTTRLHILSKLLPNRIISFAL